MNDKAKHTQILFVEDDELLVKMYQQKLEREGFSVHTETNGREAIGWLSTNTPKLVLLDILLPGANGLQVLKAIRRSTHLKNTKIVILTNLSESDSHVVGDIAESLNVNAYYIKAQISPSELVNSLKALLK